MSKGIIISLCDYTGIFTKPWRDAGYESIHVDPQRENNGTILEMMPVIREAVLSGQVKFVAGFFPCTDLTSAGARWWPGKFEKDRYFQAKAAMIAEQCRMVGELSGAKWMAENPRGAASSLLGKEYDFFHPFMYSGLCPDDNYTKGTCIWSGNGFVMPEMNIMPEIVQAFDIAAKYAKVSIARPRTKTEFLKQIDESCFDDDMEFLAKWYPDDRIHKASPGEDRANERSATPLGFSIANFEANS